MNNVAAGHEHEQSGQMVADEEKVGGVEDDVMNKIHQEISNAVIQDQTLERRVGGVEIPGRVGEDSAGRQEHCGRAVS